MKTIELTSVNQEAIDKEQKYLKVLIPYCQEVYNRFKGFNIKLEDLHEIVGRCRRETDIQGLNKLFTERMLERPENSHLLGLPASIIHEKMPLADYYQAMEWVIKNPLEINSELAGIDVSNLQLQEGKITKKQRADDAIADRYTTKTLIPDYAAINKENRSVTDIIKNLFK